MNKTLAVVLSLSLNLPSAAQTFEAAVKEARTQAAQAAAESSEEYRQYKADAPQKLTGLQTAAPVTGRTQMVLIPEATLEAMANEAWKEIQLEYKVSTNKAKVDRVNRIAEKIILAAGDTPDHWDVKTFETKDVNAFALPGRKIGVFTGMMDLADSDAMLAAVMGHEVAHVLNRHGNERMSEMMVIQGGMLLADLVSGSWTKSQESKLFVYMALGVFLQYGVMLPHSRTHEAEADAIGALLIAEAGYEPRAAQMLWQRMTQKFGDYHDFQATHPSHERRIQSLEKVMPQADLVRAGKIRAMDVKLDLGTRDDGKQEWRRLPPQDDGSGYPHLGFGTLVSPAGDMTAGMEFDMPLRLGSHRGFTYNVHLRSLDAPTQGLSGGGFGLGVKQRLGRIGKGTPSGRTGVFVEPYLGGVVSGIVGKDIEQKADSWGVLAEPRGGIAVNLGDKYSLALEYRHAFDVVKGQTGMHLVGLTFQFLQGRFNEMF